jgi:hypothetical protein
MREKNMRDKNTTKVPFNEVAPKMQFGDIMLFNGQYKGSRVIEFLEGSEWSHVGMVVRLEGFDEPLIWEATSLTNLPDVIFHDKKTGVKLVKLRDRIAHYGDDLEKYEAANFAWRSLTAERTPEMMMIFEGLINSMHAIPDPGFKEMAIDVIKQIKVLANKGNVDAFFLLGSAYDNGLGVNKDYRKAFDWYRKGANAGSSLAMCNLAVMYTNGLGVAVDYKKAIVWFIIIKSII